MQKRRAADLQSQLTALQRQSATLQQQLGTCRVEALQDQERIAARDQQILSLRQLQTEHDGQLAAELGVAAKSAQQHQLQLARAQRKSTGLQQRLDALDAKYQSLLATTADQTAAAQQRLATVKAERLDAQTDAAAAGQRLITVKKEKLDAEADAVGAAQRDRAAAAKRKIEADLLAETKRHRGTAEQLSAAAAANRRLEEEKESLSLECCVCADSRPSVLYLPCKHLPVRRVRRAAGGGTGLSDVPGGGGPAS